MDRSEKFDNHVDAAANGLLQIAQDLVIVGSEDAEEGALSPAILSTLRSLNDIEKDVLKLLELARELEAAEYEKATR
jgi:hypothetical protein